MRPLRKDTVSPVATPKNFHPTPMLSPQTPKFTWETSHLGAVHCWLSLPDTTVIETFCRSHLQLPADHQVAVTLLSEGRFNKLYTIAIPDSGGNLAPPRYVFRATSPVEPFYKTASEVATHSYLREHTAIPVPRIIAHSSTAKNELGCEWMLMEKVPGVPLADVWRDIDMELKSRQTKVIAGFVRQLTDVGSFTAIGNLYFREEIDAFDRAVRVLPTEDEKYVLGPIVTCFMFMGGRKLRLPRNLGPYFNDEEYMAALLASELGDMKLLISEDAHLLPNLDKGLAADAKDIVDVLNELQTISVALFPSQPRDFALRHHDLSLSNILVDPATYEITGVVDWECVGTRPHWEDTHPLFLDGEEMTEEIEPPAPGEMDEDWVEDWEKTKLRLVFDRDLRKACDSDDGKDEIRWQFRQTLNEVGVWPQSVEKWAHHARDKIALCAK